MLKHVFCILWPRSRLLWPRGAALLREPQHFEPGCRLSNRGGFSRVALVGVKWVVIGLNKSGLRREKWVSNVSLHLISPAISRKSWI